MSKIVRFLFGLLLILTIPKYSFATDTFNDVAEVINTVVEFGHLEGDSDGTLPKKTYRKGSPYLKPPIKQLQRFQKPI